MSKYLLPSPEQYAQGLFREFVIASITGQELRAKMLHTHLAEFANAMGRIVDYHNERIKGENEK